MKAFTNFLQRPRLWVLAGAAAVLLGARLAAQDAAVPAIDFDDGPLLAKNEPANVVLALSVEFPTSGAAYKGAEYEDGKLYLGYFNPTRCYTYPGFGETRKTTAAFSADTDYFSPTGSTNASFHCNVEGTGTGFSGNYLNYAAMTAPDIMRLALTGGDRGIDEPTRTVLDRGYIFTNGGAGFRHSLAAALVEKVTPFGKRTVPLHADNCADGIFFTSGAAAWAGQWNEILQCSVRSGETFHPLASDNRRQAIKPRVLVCDEGEGPERRIVFGAESGDSYAYCKKYTHGGTTGYKPEGQIQRNADRVRVAVMSYLIDDGPRHGGVLRAPMKYTGPHTYNAAGTLVSNAEKEWLPTTGQFVLKPIDDAASAGYPRSGVINYLNRFGKTGHYKTFDPVGELWYESLRYLQGLQPTPEAVNGTITEAQKDNYPVYTSWTDPVTSACQRRNFILGIGDVNTHFDRTVPGVSRAEQDAMNWWEPALASYDFTYAHSPTIAGSTGALNAHDWTQIVDSFERWGAPWVAYVDALGRNQSTRRKNPAQTTQNGALDTMPTGSAWRSSYHWAGLAYWANTQAVRLDEKNGVSMDKLRVKTFMIDVDESALADSEILKTSFYLAGKYGYFDDTASNGNPFTDPGGAQWADASGWPKGHVKASQPERLVAGIQRFFSEAAKGGSAFSAAAVSSNSLAAQSPDARRYRSTFATGEWTGSVVATQLKLHTPTNTITEDPTPVWDAGLILTEASKTTGAVEAPYVRPADRRIVTFVPGSAAGSAPKAVTFTFAGLGSDLPASFRRAPYGGEQDGLAEARIHYLRGERSGEASGQFRPRTGILGDIVNSGTVYKAGANPALQGEGYAAFFSARKNRTPVVYVGANDGMLHAFKAENGQELFAYIPGAVLDKLPNLASKSYIHTHFVDAVPVVDEVRLADGWRTVLISGMGGGGQGVFALDVTDPEAFDTGKVLFEFTDRDDPQMGNVVGRPSFVKMRTGASPTAAARYFAVVSSGYNNYQADGRAHANNDQALFFLDLGKPSGVRWQEGVNYFKVNLPAASATALNGLSQPGIRHGAAGEAIEFFAGDLQGNLWKAGFPQGLNSAGVLASVRKNTSGVKVPMFTASKTTGIPQPITAAPVIYPHVDHGHMVLFGTGQFLQGADRNSTAAQSVYGVWDSGQPDEANYGLTRNDLHPVTFDAAAGKFSGASAVYGLGSQDKRGWYADLPLDRERIVNGGADSTGVVSFSSTIPPTLACSDNGSSQVYFFQPSTGASAAASRRFTEGYLGHTATLHVELSDEPAYGVRATSGRRSSVRKEVHNAQGATDKGTRTVEQDFRVHYLATGRVYWRELRNFNQKAE